MEENTIQPQALKLAGLAVEFCKVLAKPELQETQEFLRECVRYIPRLYISLCDLDPYGDGGEDYDNYGSGAIAASVNEEQYEMVRQGIAEALGEYDVYLDTPAEAMRFSESPVAVSLAEQLADVFQLLGDFATTVSVSDEMTIPDVLADLKFSFHNYLADTLCSALRAANMLYQSQELKEE